MEFLLPFLLVLSPHPPPPPKSLYLPLSFSLYPLCRYISLSPYGILIVCLLFSTYYFNILFFHYTCLFVYMCRLRVCVCVFTCAGLCISLSHPPPSLSLLISHIMSGTRINLSIISNCICFFMFCKKVVCIECKTNLPEGTVT